MSEHDDLSFDEFDERFSPRPERTMFDDIADRALSRRAVLKGSAALSIAGLLPGLIETSEASSRLAFKQVAANGLDTVTLPPGYSWYPLVSWGDPLWSSGVEFDDTTRGTGASQELAFGDNCDGMEVFTDDGKTLLVVNNEYVNRQLIYGNRLLKKPQTLDDVRKGKAAHGVSIVEVVQDNHKWQFVKDSAFNRRITADTPMSITGPARGHALVKTAADPEGVMSLGTWNNCGSGRTPWGTYLACEENFNGYFSASDDFFEPTPAMNRYGLRRADYGYGWAKADERFDLSRHPNEPNRCGYVVEIDPWNTKSMPRKLTALGRLKHENAEVVLAKDGRVVVYMGDDERGEFLYRYVSRGTLSPGGNGAGLLEDGTLYVARFSDDLRGEWVALTPETTGMESVAEICVLTRLAASAAGATTMDRPEWVASNPHAVEVYCSLTNNIHRVSNSDAGKSRMKVNGPNPRAKNRYGQIVRWRPDNEDHGATGFSWDLFVLAGNPTVHNDQHAGSLNINAENMFNSPDGLAFDSRGLLWIQTDGKYSNTGDYAGMGNNQMLIGDPVSGEIKRFMVGPQQCEVTGLAWSPDKRTVFAGIQHPGSRGKGHFPGGGSSVPRSTVIAIKRDDNGPIG